MRPQNKEDLASFAEAIFRQGPWQGLEDEDQEPEEDLNPDLNINLIVAGEGEVEAEEIKAPLVVVPTFFIFALDLAGDQERVYAEDFSGESEAEIMLKRMILSLNLPAGSWRVWVCPQGDNAIRAEALDEFFSSQQMSGEFLFLSFGVRMTELLLGKRQRISEIHGQKVIGRLNLSVIPLFHPEYLVINPSMKRTVWQDLQVIKSISP